MRRSLALLAITGLLPVVVLGAAFGTASLRDQRAALTRQAAIESRFAARLIGRELADNQRAMRMVAQSPAFDAELDEVRFRTLAARLIADEPGWRAISIADPAGARVIDVPMPIGGVARGKVVDMESLRRTVETARPTIGSVMRGPGGQRAFAVRAPIVRGGKVVYVVSAVVPAAAMQPLLLAEAVPPGWTITLRDQANQLVAGAGSAAGTGPMHVTASAIPESGWSVEVGMPKGELTWLARGAALILGGGTLVSLLLVGFLAALLLRELRQLRTREAATIQGQRLEALGRLTGGVAHDFNNLLTPILGGLDLLRRRVGSDEKALRHIDSMAASAERARTLVLRLLAFARRQELATRRVALPPLLGGLAELLERLVGPGIALVIRVPSDIPAVEADPAQLELAIVNLAVNARDAMPDGGTITVEAAAAEPRDTKRLGPGRYVSIRVVDTGRGMDADTLRQAIEPFFTTKGAERGTGLGLSMVHGFAAQSNGAFTLESRPGEGTRATLLLPVSEAEAVPEAPAPLPPAPAGPARLLVVDDEPEVRAATAEMLRAGGHAVEEAGSVDEALALIEAGLAPDLIVTDHLMPGGSGGELIRRVRARHAPARFLLVTGFMSGATDVPADVERLAKPFRQDELMAAVDASLG